MQPKQLQRGYIPVGEAVGELMLVPPQMAPMTCFITSQGIYATGANLSLVYVTAPISQICITMFSQLDLDRLHKIREQGIHQHGFKTALCLLIAMKSQERWDFSGCPFLQKPYEPIHIACSWGYQQLIFMEMKNKNIHIQLHLVNSPSPLHPKPGGLIHSWYKASLLLDKLFFLSLLLKHEWWKTNP